MKLAPVAEALARHGGVERCIVHTGQHYDDQMSAAFFRDLGIPNADVNLDVGSLDHGAQIGRILERYEAHVCARRPSATVVFGDVNGTLACALAAARHLVPVVHVEAGLRSFDRTMPEEQNRVLTDALSELLLVTEEAGVENLRREGIPDARVRLVGNTMVDTLRAQLPKARDLCRAQALGLQPGGYALATLHRPSNVDDPATLQALFGLLQRIATRRPIVFPVHPRTRLALEALDRWPGYGARHGLHLLEPERYHDMLSLLASARLVLTDSGGIQTEAACVGVPCVTLREGTEHVRTVEIGANRLVGTDRGKIEAAFDVAWDGEWPAIAADALGDGRAGERIADAIVTLVQEG